MSNKNERIIVFGLIAIGAAVILGMALIFGVGAYVYMNEPTPTPAPTPMATMAPTMVPTPTPARASSAGEEFMVDAMSQRDSRTYTLNIRLADGAAPVDMRNVTAVIIAYNETYPAWSYARGEHGWSANASGDTILDRGETFRMVIDAYQAGLPLPEKKGPQVPLELLDNGLTVYTINVTLV